MSSEIKNKYSEHRTNYSELNYHSTKEVFMKGEVKKVVLAYSGGLDTSIILKWLKNEYGCEVIAFTADVGQAEELDHLEEKAIATGAGKVYIEDLREEFARG